MATVGPASPQQSLPLLLLLGIVILAWLLLLLLLLTFAPNNCRSVVFRATRSLTVQPFVIVVWTERHASVSSVLPPAEGLCNPHGSVFVSVNLQSLVYGFGSVMVARNEMIRF